MSETAFRIQHFSCRLSCSQSLHSSAGVRYVLRHCAIPHLAHRTVFRADNGPINPFHSFRNQNKGQHSMARPFCGNQLGMGDCMSMGVPSTSVGAGAVGTLREHNMARPLHSSQPQGRCCLLSERTRSTSTYRTQRDTMNMHIAHAQPCWFSHNHEPALRSPTLTAGLHLGCKQSSQCVRWRKGVPPWCRSSARPCLTVGSTSPQTPCNLRGPHCYHSMAALTRYGLLRISLFCAASAETNPPILASGTLGARSEKAHWTACSMPRTQTAPRRNVRCYPCPRKALAHPGCSQLFPG